MGSTSGCSAVSPYLPLLAVRVTTVPSATRCGTQRLVPYRSDNACAGGPGPRTRLLSSRPGAAGLPAARLGRQAVRLRCSPGGACPGPHLGALHPRGRPAADAAACVLRVGAGHLPGLCVGGAVGRLQGVRGGSHGGWRWGGWAKGGCPACRGDGLGYNSAWMVPCFIAKRGLEESDRGGLWCRAYIMPRHGQGSPLVPCRALTPTNCHTQHARCLPSPPNSPPVTVSAPHPWIH